MRCGVVEHVSAALCEDFKLAVAVYERPALNTVVCGSFEDVAIVIERGECVCVAHLNP
jgi:hypothetical protein